MINITINSYDEAQDIFNVTMKNLISEFAATLPATLIPYIAPDLCDRCEDLPFDLIGQSFEMN